MLAMPSLPFLFFSPNCYKPVIGFLTQRAPTGIKHPLSTRFLDWLSDLADRHVKSHGEKLLQTRLAETESYYYLEFVQR